MSVVEPVAIAVKINKAITISRTVTIITVE